MINRSTKNGGERARAQASAHSIGSRILWARVNFNVFSTAFFYLLRTTMTVNDLCERTEMQPPAQRPTCTARTKDHHKLKLTTIIHNREKKHTPKDSIMSCAFHSHTCMVHAHTSSDTFPNWFPEPEDETIKKVFGVFDSRVVCMQRKNQMPLNGWWKESSGYDTGLFGA